MSSYFQFRKNKVEASMLVILLGLMALGVFVAIFLVAYSRAEASRRAVWEVALVVWILLVFGMVVAEIWSICAREQYLFEEKQGKLKAAHPKSYRITMLWLAGLLGMGILTFVAYLVPDILVILLVATIDCLVLRHLVKRTRRIMQRTSFTRHVY